MEKKSFSKIQILFARIFKNIFWNYNIGKKQQKKKLVIKKIQNFFFLIFIIFYFQKLILEIF